MIRLPRLATPAVALALAGAASAQCVYDKVLGPTLEVNGWAGESVAIFGNMMLLGEPNINATSSDSGRVSIFERDAMGAWINTGFAKAPFAGNNSNDRFGTSVALSNGVGLAGAPYGGPGDAGVVCFFEDTGPVEWTIKTSHTPADAAPFDNFGRAVAIDGDHAVVGAPFHDKLENLTLSDTGAAYFYKRNPDGTWSFNGKGPEEFVALRNPTDHFGAAVAIKDNYAIVGAPDGNMLGAPGSGWVRVYRRTANGWVVVTTLSVDGQGQLDGGYGRSVAYDGEFLVVGAPEMDFQLENAGSAYVYRRSGDSFILETTLTPQFGATDTRFGQQVAVSNGRIAVSRDDHTVELYARSVVGAWIKHKTIEDPDGFERFGFSMAGRGDHLVVGDPYDDNEGTFEAGAAYRFSFGFGANHAAQAPRLSVGDTFSGCTDEATNDGSATCGNSNTSRDVWYVLTVPAKRTVALSTLGSAFDTVLSVHSNAPGNAANQIVCNDDYAPPQRWSRVTFVAQPGMLYFVRVAGWNNAQGEYVIAATSGLSCPGDADGDGQINFNDLNTVLGSYNATGENLPADFDLDGDVDFADLNTVISNYNSSC